MADATKGMGVEVVEEANPAWDPFRRKLDGSRVLNNAGLQTVEPRSS